MYLPLGQYSPDVRIGLVSASRNCFPRELSRERTDILLDAAQSAGLDLVCPKGECAIIETKDHAREAAAQLTKIGCDAVVLFLGNFSPEIEDACFVKAFQGPIMVLAAAEESRNSLLQKRGDALCGLLSAVLAIKKRNLLNCIHIPENPIIRAEQGVAEIDHFIRIIKVVKGTRNANLGLFGPRPRDFETCNYNIASITSMGIEVEELGLFDLENEIRRIEKEEDSSSIAESMRAEVPGIPDESSFVNRLSNYEKAVNNFRETLKLSGAASQCWSQQEFALKHVPCFINGRMAGRGFPIACENDAYSLVAELLAQYASDQAVTILDINHTIPTDLHESLKNYPIEDMVGMFHCGNTATQLLKNPEMKHQLIMKRVMEPDTDPDITRGTIEGQIKASPITVFQVHGSGDKMRAYLCQGYFLDLDPKTFGCTGTAYLPGFMRFYRHVLLGRFHHHAAVAFTHCADVLYDALKLIGIEEIHTPVPDCIPYPGENVFRSGRVPVSQS